MSINLLGTLKSKVGSKLAEHSAAFLGEDHANMGPAVDGTFAALLAGMIQKVSTDRGAKELHSVLKDEEVKDFDLENIFVRSPQTVNGLVNRGTHFLPNLFPNTLRSATNAVSAASKITKDNSTKLAKIGTPMMLSVLGQHVQENNLSIDGLKSLLNGQKDAVKSALPATFFDAAELSSFGWTKKVAAMEAPKPKKVKPVKVEKVMAKEPIKTAAAAAATAKPAAVAASSAGGMGFLKWLLPILAILGLVGFFAMRGCTGDVKMPDVPKVEVPDVAAAVKEKAAAATTVAKSMFGNVNEAAMGLLGKIKFAAGSAGEQMMSFLKSSNSGEGRFRFKNLNFASGSANIAGKSGLEVDNVAAILKAYEDVKVNIEGFTDSRGKAASNQILSQKRAEAVRTRLTALGIPDARITTKGFGAASPVATNDTAEGRAQNRRIEIVIVK